MDISKRTVSGRFRISLIIVGKFIIVMTFLARWHHELLYRNVVLDFQERERAFRKEREKLEERFICDANSLMNSANIDQQSLLRQCLQCTERSFTDTYEAEEIWIQCVRRIPWKGAGISPLYWLAWRKENKRANIDNSMVGPVKIALGITCFHYWNIILFAFAAFIPLIFLARYR